VTVTGVDDGASDGPQSVAVNAGPLTSADPAFQGASGSVLLVNQDDELVQITPRGGTTTEAGGAVQLAVHLGSALPFLGEAYTADWGYQLTSVTVHFTSSNPQEGTVTPESLTFDGSNYSTNQLVTVQGVDDGVVDGDVGFTVGVSVTSNTASYAGTPVAPLSFTNTDND
jgi:hypothetical protein